MTDQDARRRAEAVRMAHDALSRRGFLGRSAALFGGAVVAPAVLAACGSSSGSKGGSGGNDKSVAISNWTSYISNQSKKDFTKDTGIKLTYTEDINDNNEYFAKIRPNLSRDRSIGRDGFVLTDWMANRMINQVKWVSKLDAAQFPNKKNLRAALQHPGFDPDRLYSAPWATGVAGIAYNIASTGKEVKTIEDFFAANGTKTVLSEMRDTIGLMMLADGKDITKPTFADAEPAFNRLEKALSDGTLAGTNGNEYVNDLGAGNLAAAFAWSGDVAQISKDNPDIRFAVPESGGTLWSDNFLIPYTSDKPDLGTDFINFFYDPKNAAVLTAEIQYISPVDGVDAELTKLGGDAAKLVDNPLVVPTDEFLAQLSIFGVLDETAEEKFDKRFAEVTGAG
ncbi:MAG: spermidine/putrescine ABC transporter substrate-binding protein [Acidimicrobiia bacterium]|nr:spermidine/putrescine ABC transporter substrate-binding protein [Acidimicrobiia bacterium]